MVTGAALIVIACSALSGSAKTAVITLSIARIVISFCSMVFNIAKKATKEG